MENFNWGIKIVFFLIIYDADYLKRDKDVKINRINLQTNICTKYTNDD